MNIFLKITPPEDHVSFVLLKGSIIDFYEKIINSTAKLEDIRELNKLLEYAQLGNYYLKLGFQIELSKHWSEKNRLKNKEILEDLKKFKSMGADVLIYDEKIDMIKKDCSSFRAIGFKSPDFFLKVEEKEKCKHYKLKFSNK